MSDGAFWMITLLIGLGSLAFRLGFHAVSGRAKPDRVVGVDISAKSLADTITKRPQFDLAVTLRNGHLSKRLSITAQPPDGDLVRIGV